MAIAAPVDLSTWTAEGTGGNWVLQPGNTAVLQTLNTNTPAVFFNGANSQGLALSGEITVTTTGDDDFIGFVLGYNAGDATNASADYLLIDWKQGNQINNGVLGAEGLAISRVTGVFDFDEFWSHTGVVQELQRGTNLGSTGWNDNQTYAFDLQFTATNVMVSVDGVTEININGSFQDGSFGFYNMSQASVLYAGIEEDIAFCEQFPDDPQCTGGGVPTPAPLALLALGLMGILLSRHKTSN